MNRSVLPLALIGLSLSATACRCGGSEPTPTPTPGAEEAEETNEFNESTAEAVATARPLFFEAIEASAVPDVEALQRHFDAAIASEDMDRVALVMDGFPRGTSRRDTVDMEIRGLQAMGRFSDARDAVVSAMLLDPEDDSYAELMARLWATDPEFQTEREVWTVEDGYTLEPFHGSSSIIFEVTSHGQRAASFKPAQTIRRQYYRSEVAAYQLARVLGLELTVPLSTEVQIDWDTFHEISELEPGDESFHQTNAELIWLEEGGSRFLRGVSKEWVNDLERFPVEYVDAWHPLVDGSRPVNWLHETSVADALAGFEGRPRDHYEGVVAAAQFTSTYNLAAQLSDLHVFDVLTNNYDRYQPEGLQLGMNCHIGHGGITSLDNGAGFPTRDDHDWRRVRSKISDVRWYSRATYTALVSIDPESIRTVLFPASEHGDNEDDRYEYFLERWQWMREHIDSLIQEHGEDAVLVFD